MAYLKGRSFEWALKDELKENGWYVVRSAGSKKPDLVAAKGGKVMVIECKVTKEDKIYLDKEEVFNLKKVADAFGGEGIFAVKQLNKPWCLVDLKSLRETERNYTISL